MDLPLDEPDRPYPVGFGIVPRLSDSRAIGFDCNDFFSDTRQRDGKEAGSGVELQDMAAPGVFNDFFEERSEQKPIGLKERIRRYLVMDIPCLKSDAFRSFNGTVRQDKACDNLRCAQRMNFQSRSGIYRRDEVIQLRNK